MMVFRPFDVQWCAHLVGPRGCGKSSFLLLLKAVLGELVGETTLSNVCNADADMRRRTSATLVSKNLIFVDEAEVPDVVQKGELAQPFETENLLQLSRYGGLSFGETSTA